jgi:ribonuclease-3
MCQEIIETEDDTKPDTESDHETSVELQDKLILDKNRLEELYTLEYRIDYVFNDIKLMDQSLTHKSAISNNDSYSICNERMEFLGDAVLELVVSSFLYKEFPDYTEGQLSKLKAVIVSQSILTSRSRELELGEFIRFGSGESSTGGKDKSSNLANALEAIIAAIYIDGGLKAAEKFILKIFSDEIQELDKDEMKRDYKSALQEYWQASFQKPPVYKVINQTGPDHDKRFEIEVTLSGESYGRGIGRNKKEAEQRAAEKALETIFNRRREEDTD